MSSFFLEIVNMSISASWIVLAVLLLRLLLKKAPKWITVLLWSIVAVRLICPFSIESAMSLIPSSETINTDIMVEGDSMLENDIVVEHKPLIDTGVSIINDAVNPIIEENFSPEPEMEPQGDISMTPMQGIISILSWAWVGGMVVMLAYTVISYLRVKNKIGTAVLLRDNIYQSENVVSPFVLGVVKPRIYLPFNMDEQDMEHVIAHENAHIRRKDHLWKQFGFLLLTLHWFNPFIWLGYVLLCRDIELACDEKVVKEFDNQQKADYAQALLTCSMNRRMIAACPIAFGEVGVKDRVKSVLNYKKPAFWIIIVAIIASSIAAVCFLTDPVSKEDASESEDVSESEVTSENKNTIETITFRVNDSLPEYNATVTYNQENPRLADTLVISEKESRAQIQKIDLPENDCFTKEPLYVLDITFDGNLDILVPREQPASAVYFQAYIWNEKENQFIYAPTFENLPNIALDRENKLVLSSRTASKITSYGMSYYDTTEKDFIGKYSLYMEPTEDEQLLHFVEEEFKNGERKTIAEDTIAVDNPYIPDETNPAISHYYEKGSLWDLNSEKWEAYIYVTKNVSEGTNIAEKSELLLGVLRNETKFIDEDGKEIYLKDYKLTDSTLDAVYEMHT